MNVLLASSLIMMLSGADTPPVDFTTISQSYRGTVQQAFDSHCADCHGKAPDDLPTDARITAQKKSKRAHKKFSMDEGFPFRSKWPLAKLMAEIRDEVEDLDMPPKKYMKQKGRHISDAERSAIIGWAREAENSAKAP